jgi:CRP-like cAMP-binding protein
MSGIDMIEISSRIKQGVQEKSEMMEKTPWSNEFRWGEIETFAKHMSAYMASKGTVICREGAREAFMCLIVEGKVKVLKRDSERENRVITAFGPGKTFGEMSLIDGEPRSATVIAADNTILLVLTEEGYLNLLEETPRLGAKLLVMIARAMSQRLRQTSGVLVDYLGF